MKLLEVTEDWNFLCFSGAEYNGIYICIYAYTFICISNYNYDLSKKKKGPAGPPGRTDQRPYFEIFQDSGWDAKKYLGHLNLYLLCKKWAICCITTEEAVSILIK
jgi:hypothetical protein